MLSFAFRRMFSRKGLFAALLLGNLLFISLASSMPMFSRSVMQRMLTDSFEEYLEENNAYPGQISVTFSGSISSKGKLPGYEEWALTLPEQYGIPSRITVINYRISQLSNDPEIKRSDARIRNANLCALSDLQDHALILAGRMFRPGISEDGTVEVIISQNALATQSLLLNEKRTFRTLKDAEGRPFSFRVVGVFDIADEEDIYWVKRPGSMSSDVYMDFDTFSEIFRQDDSYAVGATWYQLLDTDLILADDVSRMVQVTENVQDKVRSVTGLNTNCRFADILTEHQTVGRKVSVTLWVLQAPVFVLLAAFVFMVSRRIVETEQSEIAVLKSRGVQSRSIFAVYLLQSFLVAAFALVPGVLLGSFLTQALGSVNGFLSFVNRTALPVKLDSVVLLYAFSAALVALVAGVLPVFRYTRVSVVEQKRKKHRRTRPMWQKLFLDVIALGISLYGLYTFQNQKDYLAAQILAGATPDPLLLLCPSLFMIGAGLLFVRLLPLLIQLIYRLFRSRWSPALYASFLQVLREKGSRSFLMIFLVMTVSLGLFNAETARSINDNAEQNIRYMTGTEFVLKESWQSQEVHDSSSGPDSGAGGSEWIEPRFSRFEEIEGVESVAKVYVNNSATVSVHKGTLNNATVMGIDTRAFGKTALFDTSLLPIHWYRYLNAIARNPVAVLVSSNLRDTYGYALGDSISFKVAGTTCNGVIYGFVSYFPGWAPEAWARGADGLVSAQTQSLIVANLSQLQSWIGVMPYSVWMRTSDGGDGLYRWTEESLTQLESFRDLEVQLAKQKNTPMIRSLNGILTVSFVTVLLLCFVGFLMDWILSVRSRTLLWGIYRAMGMTLREVLTMLLHEQICVSLTSVCAGVAVGGLTAKLYMPLVRMAYVSGDSVLPLSTVTHPEDTMTVLITVGAMLIICLAILLGMLKRMKIGQALKLGED